jgi:hypothetical protein
MMAYKDSTSLDTVDCMIRMAFKGSTSNNSINLNTLDSYKFLDNISSSSDFVGELSSLPFSSSSVTKDGSSKNAPIKKTKPQKKLRVARKNKTKTKTKRCRCFIPEDKDYIDGEPTDLDVTAGRGGKSNHHKGNKPYWKLILTHRNTYRGLSTDFEKKDLARNVATTIRESGGRFLMKEKTATGEKWFEMPEKAYLVKIGQAFRDKYIVEWAREWAEKDFPEEYALHLQTQQEKRAKTNKKGTKARSKNTDFRKVTVPTTRAAMTMHDETLAVLDKPARSPESSKPNQEVMIPTLCSLQNSALNFSQGYSDGTFSHGTFSHGTFSLGSTSIPAAQNPGFASMFCANGESSLDDNQKGTNVEQQTICREASKERRIRRARHRGWVMEEYYRATNTRGRTEEV